MNVKGSVSVYAAGIFLCIMLLLLAVVENLFIYLGHNKVTSGMYTTLGYGLSHYNKELLDDYGLFGVHEDQVSSQDYSNVLQDNLYSSGEGIVLDSYEIDDLAFSYPTSLIEPEEMESQIVQYMKYRVPVSILDPLIQQLESLSKAGSSGQLLEKKEEDIVEPMTQIQNSYNQLIRYIEGVYKGKVKKGFVKQLAFPMESYNTSIPDASLLPALKAQLIDYQGFMDEMNQIPQSLKLLEDIQDLEDQLIEFKKNKDKEQASEEEAIEEEINNILDELSQLWDEDFGSSNKCLTHMKKRLKAGITDFEVLVDVHEKAIKEIDSIESLSQTLSVKIENYKEYMKENKEEYVASLVTSVEKELKVIEEQIDFTYMMHVKNQLTQNKKSVENFLQVILKNREGLFHASSVDKTLKSIGEAGQNLADDYNVNFILSYGAKGQKQRSPLKQMKKQVKENEEHEDYKQGKSIEHVNLELLPSAIIKTGLLEERESKLNLDEEEEMNKGYFDFLSRFENINLSREILTELYINEYVLTMFASALDNEEEGYLNAQVEYVLSGKSSDGQNIFLTDSKLLFVRSAMNVIHILCSNEKKLAVKGLATSIAGWWSLGIGTVVLEGILIGLWALGESYMDLRAMKSGEKVAFYKLDQDWQLSLMGLKDFVIDEAEDLGVKATENLVDSAGEKINTLISTAGQQLEGAMAEQVGAIMDEVSGQVTGMVEDQVRGLSDQIDRYIGEAALALMENKSIPGSTVLDAELINALNKEIMTYKDELLDKGHGQVENVVLGVRGKCEGRINALTEQLISQGEEGLKNLVDSSSQQVKEAMTKSIKETTGAYRDKLEDTKLEELKNPSKGRANFIKLGYTDYLRLFLLLQSKETTLLRVADIIQMKYMKAYGDDFSLYAYKTSIGVQGSVRKKLLFYRFLNSAVEKSKALKELQSYKVELVRGYR